MVARFNGADYCLLNHPEIATSSRETNFTNITIEFTGKTNVDLPVKFQEIKLVDTSVIPEKIIYLGYVNETELPTFNSPDQVVFLDIELLSPQTYLSKRTVEKIITNANIREAIIDILSPIVSEDGFIIVENTLPTTKYLTDIFLNQSVEKIMNNLAARFKFIWYVDELKNIYLKDIEEMELEAVVETIDSTSFEFLEYVKPTVEAVDYANKICLNNIKLITNKSLIASPITITEDLTRDIDFLFPFSLSESVYNRAGQEQIVFSAISVEDGVWFSNYVISFSNGTLNIPPTIGFFGDGIIAPQNVLLLKRDANNPNLIVGMRVVKEFGGSFVMQGASATTCLIDFSATYYDPLEIANNKALINTSGIIEKVVDTNGKYFTILELSEYIKSLLSQNNRQANKLELQFRGLIDANFLALKNKLTLGKKIKVDLPAYFVPSSEYAITDISYGINVNVGILNIEARITNVNENYLDIFRKPEEQLDERSVQNKIFGIYVQEEKTMLEHRISVGGEVVNDV